MTALPVSRRVLSAAERVRGVTEHLTDAEQLRTVRLVATLALARMPAPEREAAAHELLEGLRLAVRRAAELPAHLMQTEGRA